MSAGIDRQRLAAILGMLGSAHAGEVVNAARQAERMRREAGVSWSKVIASPRLADDIDDDEPLQGWRLHLLTPWERNFISSVSRQRYPLSTKQRRVLRRLVDKATR